MSEYSAVAAKLKAMHAKSLDAADFDELLNQQSVGEICGCLKTKAGYEELLKDVREKDAHRGVIEYLLQIGLLEEYTRLYNFMNRKQRKVISFWFMRNEIDYIKNQIRHVCINERVSMSIMTGAFNSFFENHSRIDTQIMENASSMEDCIEACRETPYYHILRRACESDADLFSIGMMLDGFYYTSLWKTKDKVLDKKQSELFEGIVGPKIDMLNLMWIYRGKKYFNFQNDVIFTYLLPTYYRLNRDIIIKLVRTPSAEDMVRAAKETVYAGLFDGLEHGIFPEENYRKIQYKKAKNTFTNHTESMAAAVAYLDLKEIEMNNIITVIEGVRYSLNTETIREHIQIAREGGK